MENKIIKLPDGLIGKEEEARLESFGRYLVLRGVASRWRWRRKYRVNVGFEILRSNLQAEIVSIERDRRKDVYLIRDARGERIEEGTLEHVMTVVEEVIRTTRTRPWA